MYFSVEDKVRGKNQSMCILYVFYLFQPILAGLKPEAIPKYDTISKRLKAIAEVLETKDLSKCFRSLCGSMDLLDICYTKSWVIPDLQFQQILLLFLSNEVFRPIESPVPNTAFDDFRKILNVRYSTLILMIANVILY